MTHNPKPESGGIPADVRAVVEALGESIYGRHERGWVCWPLVGNLPGRIARAILDDRERAATAILAARYTEDQGIDAEMASFNDGLEEAAKIVRGNHLTTPTREDA